MRRAFLASSPTAVLVTAAILSLTASPSPHAAADEDLVWKGRVSAYWKSTATDTAGGTSVSTDWSATWTIKSQLPQTPVGESTVRVPAELTLKGTRVETYVGDCSSGPPDSKATSVSTITAVATVADNLLISTPTTSEARVNWHSLAPIPATQKTVSTRCDGQVERDEARLAASPELRLTIPMAANRVAHGSATIPYDPFGLSDNIVSFYLGMTPNKTSTEVTWDLSGGRLHHFVVEARSWIPLERIVHPLFPSPRTWAESVKIPLNVMSPNCLLPPVEERNFTEVSATFRGDNHTGFDGTYRLAHRIEFDYDGQSITNFTATPHFAHVGATHEDKRFTVIGMAEPHPARECTRTGLAPDQGNASSGAREFQLTYRGSNPLVAGSPPIIHTVEGLIRDNGVVAIKYTVTNFPSSGVRVTRDGIEIGTVLTNDVSCVPYDSAHGYSGVVKLGYGLATTRTGAFDVDYRTPARQTIRSALCSGLWSP
jgi:hypothetical protein